MALEGISELPTAPVVKSSEKVTEYDIPAAVDLNVNVVKELRRIEDEDRLRDSMTREFTELAVINQDFQPGRLFFRPSFIEGLTFKQLVEAMDGKRPDGSFRYAKTDTSDDIWSPSRSEPDYSRFITEDFNRIYIDNVEYSLSKWISRLAILSNDPQGSLFHFANISYDSSTALPGAATQQGRFTRFRDEYESNPIHEDCVLTTMSFADFAILSIISRLEDIPLPFARHQYGRCPDMGRKIYGRTKYLGTIGTDYGQNVKLDSNQGYDDDHHKVDGIGIAASLRRDF